MPRYSFEYKANGRPPPLFISVTPNNIVGRVLCEAMHGSMIDGKHRFIAFKNDDPKAATDQYFVT
jgi:hypothetical protein